MSEEILEKILENAKRIVPSLATPGYWHPAGTAKDPSEHVAIRKAEMDWLVNALKKAEQELDDLYAAVNEVVAEWEESAARPLDIQMLTWQAHHASEIRDALKRWEDS